jgi:hypothetical protein
MTRVSRRVRDDAHEIRAVGHLWAVLLADGLLEPRMTAPEFLDEWHKAVERTEEERKHDAD